MIRMDYAPAPLSVPEVQQALERILAGAPLRSSPRLASFLRFVVNATLAGEGRRIKGYTIGVEALGRPDDFDPQIDPIVRVEALRLRRGLAQYYSNDGIRDPVVIELPRGRYLPIFRRAHPTPRTFWRQMCGALQQLLAADGPRLLPPATAPLLLQTTDGRQVQQAESAPAPRPRRPRPSRDRGDAPYDRGDPRGL
jgi:hypothetical protein